MQTLSTIIWRNWLGLLLFVIACFLLFRQCEANKVLVANNNALTTEKTTFKNQIGTLTTRVSTLQLTQKELRQQMSDTVAKLAKGFYKIQTVTVTKFQTKIDTVKVTFKEPIPCRFVREGSERKEWYSFNYKIDSTGFQLSNMVNPTKMFTVTGTQRKWFLGRQTLVTEISFDNPNILILDATSIKTVVKPKWYDSKLFTFAAGFVAAEIKNKL